MTGALVNAVLKINNKQINKETFFFYGKTIPGTPELQSTLNLAHSPADQEYSLLNICQQWQCKFVEISGNYCVLR